jgi:hypothetical protein
MLDSKQVGDGICSTLGFFCSLMVLKISVFSKTSQSYTARTSCYLSHSPRAILPLSINPLRGCRLLPRGACYYTNNCSDLSSNTPLFRLRGDNIYHHYSKAKAVAADIMKLSTWSSEWLGVFSLHSIPFSYNFASDPLVTFYFI